MYPIEKYQFKVYEKTNEDNTKSSVVVALSTFAGRPVKGVAKCMEGDPFSLEKGKELAAARCDYKVCVKRAKKAKKEYDEVVKKFDALYAKCKQVSSYYSDTLNEAIASNARLDALYQSMC